MRLNIMKINSFRFFFVYLFIVLIFTILTHNVHGSIDPNQLEYQLSIGPITGSTSANYVYASIFNPSGSGRTAIIKKILINVNAVNSALYQSITLRRVSSASAGTQILPTNVPKKNTNSSDTVLQIRHTGSTVTLSGTTNSRLMYVVAPGALGSLNGYKEVDFGNNEKLILQPGEGIALFQETAGDADQRISILVEWEEETSPPASQGEYILNYPRVEAAATANYVYNSFFNPVISGKTAIVKRIKIEVNCDAAAIYTNDIAIRKITSASGGTAIAVADIPKKHTSTSDTAMDIRHTGVTVNFAGSINSRLNMVTPCAIANQIGGNKEIIFFDNDEKLILHQGEGIALYTEAAGDADQITRMLIEWQEVNSASTPASQGEYVISYPKVKLAATKNSAYHTFFNPSSSGKTAIIKRIEARLDAANAAVYQPITVRKITAASGGTTVIAAVDVPKKHNSTVNTVMELRSSGATAITTTYAGTVNSRLLSINGQGAVGQLHSRKEIIFGSNEKIVLRPGEGIALYSEAAGDLDQHISFSLDWDEETTPPISQGEYIISIGPISGSTISDYNYASFFNPSSSTKTAIIKRLWIGIDAVSTAVYIPFTLRRITSASAGTLIPLAEIPKKNNASNNSVIEIRHTGVNVGTLGTADSRLISVQSPGAVGTNVAPQLTGHKEIVFENDEKLILKPGEGFVLYQEAVGDADFRVKLLVEWDEESSTPVSQGDHLMSIGPIPGSLLLNYVYGSFFNPLGSNKEYNVKKIEIRANRIGTLVAPGYVPITIRQISSASVGTQILSTNIPKKHTSTVNSTAEIRHTNPIVTFFGVTDSRLLGVTAPGAIGQAYGDYESIINYQDVLIIKPGQGLALFQESAVGDLLMRYRFVIVWNESSLIPSGDSTPPVWFNPQKNETTVYQNTFVLFNTSWTDDSSLSGYIFSINQTGLWINTSFKPFGGSSNVSINITKIIANPGTNVQWRFYANDTSNNWNQTPIQNFTVNYLYGYLNSSLIAPLGTNNQPQNQTFVLTANISCIGQIGETIAICGSINGTVRYNSSTANPDAAIQGNNISTTPFYTIQSNPQTCGFMNSSSPICNLSWIVNTTGLIGKNYKLDVNFTSNETNVQSNKTNFTIINIISPALNIIISNELSNVQFSSLLNPGTTNNSALNNSNNLYNITCDYSPGKCNISIKGNSNLISEFSYFGISNVSWNQVNNLTTKKFLSLNYNMINESLNHLSTQFIYFWINIPPGQIAGNYKSNFTINGGAN